MCIDVAVCGLLVKDDDNTCGKAFSDAKEVGFKGLCYSKMAAKCKREGRPGIMQLVHSLEALHRKLRSFILTLIISLS